MKIAVLVVGGVDRSGTARVIPCLLALIERLVRQGDEVHVFALYQQGEPGSWQLHGASVRNAGGRLPLWRTLLELIGEHRKGPFDVLHAFWSKPAFIGAVASIALRRPLIVTLVEGELVHYRSIRFGHQGSMRNRLALRFATRQARVITTQTEFMRGLAARLGISARTVVLGVDRARWPIAPPRQRTPGAPLQLLHVGGLRPVKDQATLLRALALLRQANELFAVKIVGEGSLERIMREKALELGLVQNICFVGPVPHSDLRLDFERADVLVVSSIYESGPLVALEAALAGVPTVGTNVGYVADWAPEAAVAVPVGDPAALATAISELARDEPRRLRLARAAQVYASREDAEQTVGTFRAIYREVQSADARIGNPSPASELGVDI